MEPLFGKIQFWHQAVLIFPFVTAADKYSRAPFSTRIRWMNAVAQIKFALIEQSNQYGKKLFGAVGLTFGFDNYSK